MLHKSILCWLTAGLLCGADLRWIDVPFYRQPREGCGAAALAMVARYWKRHVPSVEAPAVDAVYRLLYAPEAKGIHASVLTAHFGQLGFEARQFGGEWQDITRHIGLGRPLIACVTGAPLHYVVITGAGEDRVRVLDPESGRREFTRRRFESLWAGCGNWLLLAVPSGRSAVLPKIHQPAPGEYSNEYRATSHFVDGNYAAAVKYWNRLDKPRLDAVRFVPDLRLAEKAVPVSAGDILTPGALEQTASALDRLGFVASRQIELVALPEERFELEIRTTRRRSFPNWMSVLRGAPFQAVHIDLYDIGSRGVNWENLLRFDAQKRRLHSRLDGPLPRDAGWRYSAFADARREVWNTGGPDFRLHRTEAGAGLAVLANSRLDWQSGVSFIWREYRGGPQEAPASVKLSTGAGLRLLTLPEHRFTLQSRSWFELARLTGSGRSFYTRWQGALDGEWTGRSHALSFRAGGGAAGGQLPFDELFMLGLERDNDLVMRAHIGTRDGKKGSAPMARHYAVVNTGFERTLYRHGLFTIAAGPLLDAGKAFAATSGEHRWMFDPGASVAAVLPGGWKASFTAARDLRAGNNAFYLNVTSEIRRR